MRTQCLMWIGYQERTDWSQRLVIRAPSCGTSRLRRKWRHSEVTRVPSEPSTVWSTIKVRIVINYKRDGFIWSTRKHSSRMRVVRFCGSWGVSSGRYGPRGVQPYPRCGRIDTCLWKHYLPATSLAGGNKELGPLKAFSSFAFATTSTWRIHTNTHKTRMHSSKMHTTRLLTISQYALQGGVPTRGVYLPRGVPTQVPPLWTEWQTGAKI